MKKLWLIFVFVLLLLDFSFCGVAIHKLMGDSTHIVRKVEPVILVQREPEPNLTEEQQIDNQIVKATIRITSPMGTGTGVVIYQDKKIAYIITACHVIEDAAEFATGTYRDDIHLIAEHLSLVSSTKDNDLAILSSKPSWLSVATLIQEPKEVVRFIKCYSFGYPGGFTIHGVFSSGEISDLNCVDFHTMARMVTTAPVISGNSGGGIWIKHNGQYKLIGILQGVYYTTFGQQRTPIPNINFASTPEQTLKFIKNSITNNK